MRSNFEKHTSKKGGGVYLLAGSRPVRGSWEAAGLFRLVKEK